MQADEWRRRARRDRRGPIPEIAIRTDVGRCDPLLGERDLERGLRGSSDLHLGGEGIPSAMHVPGASPLPYSEHPGPRSHQCKAGGRIRDKALLPLPGQAWKLAWSGHGHGNGQAVSYTAALLELKVPDPKGNAVGDCAQAAR